MVATWMLVLLLLVLLVGLAFVQGLRRAVVAREEGATRPTRRWQALFLLGLSMVVGVPRRVLLVAVVAREEGSA